MGPVAPDRRPDWRRDWLPAAAAALGEADADSRPRLVPVRTPEVVVRDRGPVPGPPLSTARRPAVFPGTFAPLTVAHVEVARAALEAGCDLVLFTVATSSVDKEHLEDATARLAVVARYLRETFPDVPYGAAATNVGLYVDLAEATARQFPTAVRSLVCGTDKVLQIFDDRYYDRPVQEVLDDLFSLVRLLVAPRAGLEPPAHPGVVRLDVPDHVRHVSSSDVRDRLSRGDPVDGLLPPGTSA